MKTLLKKLNINKTTNLTKEYVSFLILVASFMGGAKQFITLCFYSPSLLQYFSLSQVFIDGIGIMIKIIIFLIMMFIGFIFCLYIPRFIRIIFILLAFLCTFFFLALTILPSYTPTAHLIFQNAFIIACGFLFGIMYFVGEEKRKRFLFFIFLYGLFMIISDHQQADDIINIKNHNSQVYKKYPNAKLLYSNDTYLFYGIPKDQKKEIINTGMLLPPPPEKFVVCNFYIEKKDILFDEN